MLYPIFHDNHFGLKPPNCNYSFAKYDTFIEEGFMYHEITQNQAVFCIIFGPISVRTRKITEAV